MFLPRVLFHENLPWRLRRLDPSRLRYRPQPCTKPRKGENRRRGGKEIASRSCLTYRMKVMLLKRKKRTTILSLTYYFGFLSLSSLVLVASSSLETGNIFCVISFFSPSHRTIYFLRCCVKKFVVLRTSNFKLTCV